jgi:hypothetical protein
MLTVVPFIGIADVQELSCLLTKRGGPTGTLILATYIAPSPATALQIVGI